MIDLPDRRDQFSFFLGFASRKKGGQLIEVMAGFQPDGGRAISPEDVFMVAPYNDSFKQIIRSYNIFEHGPERDFKSNLSSLVAEFVFLVSDFVPPCCEDGRAFYAVSGDQLILECDRCGSRYDLNGSLIDVGSSRMARLQDFEVLVGDQHSDIWPYHQKVASFLQNKG